MRGRLARALPRGVALSYPALLAALVACLALPACAPEPAPDADTVVLVHGLGRTPASMAVLDTRLRHAGFRTVNFGYPSTSLGVEALVDSLARVVEGCCADRPGTLHFVTHSMGGLLVRAYLSERPLGEGGRVVMLSPPNHGSEIVDAFADSPLLDRILGPVGARLGTDSTDLPGALGPVDYPLGVITGNRSVNPVGSWLIPGPDDGKVGVESARVRGLDDFLIVPATHTFIMNREDVALEVVHFLRNGRFRPEGPGVRLR